jgi:1-acyl-sn-glycerol-3-phosphate acyltransferase
VRDGYDRRWEVTHDATDTRAEAGVVEVEPAMRESTLGLDEDPERGPSADGEESASGDRLPGVAIDRRQQPTAALLGLAGLLARYHRHRVLHIDRLLRPLRAGRRVIVVGNHALDVVDPLLFVATVVERYGRMPRFMSHTSWQQLPVLRAFADRYRLVPARSMEDASRALAEDGFLMLFPGGVSEAALRSYRDEPYRIKWENRLGFLRLALEHDAEIVFVAAIGNDEMYFQSRLPTPNAIVRLADVGDGKRYRDSYLRFGLLGPHVLPGVLPLPVQVTHVVSPPLVLGDRALARRDPEALAALHRSVCAACQTFLDQAVAAREDYSDTIDRTIRTGQRLLQRIGIV